MNFPIPPQAQAALKQMMSDPISFGKGKGYDVPDNLCNDPQAMVMHLIQTGQVSSPMMQQIMPMIRKMNGR